MAAVDHRAVRQLLRQVLFGSADPDIPRPEDGHVEFENYKFTPPNPPQPFLRETYLITSEINTAYDQVEAIGEVHYDVFDVLGRGTERAADIARAVSEAFPPGNSLRDSGVTINIVRTYQAPGRATKAWYFIPVVVQWRTFATISA